MFYSGFPKQWTTLKKLIWLKGSPATGATGILKTITGALLHLTDALAKPVKKFVATLEPQQSGSGDPSPTNVRPITGYTVANVTRTGKNIISWHPYTGLDYNQSVGKVVVLTDGNPITVNGNDISYTVGVWGYRDFKTPHLKAGTYYGHYINKTGSSFRGTLYVVTNNGTNDVVRSKSTFESYADASNFSITVEQNEYIVVQMGSNLAGTVELSELQIEKGNAFSGFELPDVTTIPITFPSSAGTVYGGTLENQGTDEWTLTVDRAMWLAVDLPWDKINNSSYRNFVATPPVKINYSATDKTLILSSAYKSEANNSAGSQDDNYVWTYYENPNNKIAVKDTNRAALTAEEFKTAISDVQFSCELATPITYTLTESQALTLLKGENNIWADCSDDLELTYLAEA